MEKFEDLIDKMRPINAHQIEYFYTQQFAKSALKLLIKLGIKDGEKYRFDERKKRLRQLDKLRSIEGAMIGISYHLYPRESYFDTIEVDGKHYEFLWYFMDTLNGNPCENCSPLQIIDMEWWGSIYNYLRIEVNSKKGKKTAES